MIVQLFEMLKNIEFDRFVFSISTSSKLLINEFYKSIKSKQLFMEEFWTSK